MLKYEDYVTSDFTLSSGQSSTDFIRSKFDYGTRQRRTVTGYNSFNVRLVLTLVELNEFKLFWGLLNDGADSFKSDQVINIDKTYNKIVRFTSMYSVSTLSTDLFTVTVPLELIQTGTPIPESGLTVGLTSYYPLNNDASDVYGTFTGSSFGGVSFDGNSAYFDGIDDYIDCNINNTIFHNCVSFWVYSYTRWTGSAPEFEIVGTLNTDSNVSWIAFGNPSGYISNETFSMHVFDNNYVYIQDTIEIGWHHFVIQWEIDKYVIYLDGVAVVNSYLGVIPKQTLDIELGRRPFPTYGECNHSILRIYRDTKDQAFINLLFAEGNYTP